MEDFINKLQSFLKEQPQIVNQRIASELKKQYLESESEFVDKFRRIGETIIDPTVEMANRELEEKTDRLTFKVLKDIDPNKIRQFIQVLLEIKGNDNPSDRPYLLMEGFIKSGKIKIYRNNSSDETYMNIDDINEDIIINGIKDMQVEIQQLEDKFINKFQRMLEIIIDPVVKLANQELEKKTDRLTFKIFKEIDSKKNRQFIQILLDIKDNYNPSDRPYLFIEGFMNNQEIRIFKNNGSDKTSIVIDDINNDIINNGIMDMLNDYFNISYK